MSENQVLELFKQWDTDGDGVIGYEELTQVLKKAAGLDDDEINVLFEEADANKDGVIQYEEFVNWIFGSQSEIIQLILLQSRHQPQASIEEYEGYISAGGDILEEEMTIEAAKEKCLSLPGCKGFTFYGAPSEEPKYIRFKDKWDCFGEGWTSYKVVTDEVTDEDEKEEEEDGIAQVISQEGWLEDMYNERGVVGGLDGAPAGIPIMCFPCVSDDAVNRANSIVHSMLKDSNQDVVRRMCDCNCAVGIIGSDQVGSDLPPHAFLKGLRTADGRSYDKQTRGVGGVKGRPLTSVGEENVMMKEGDSYDSESILVHEFGHSVMNLGFDERQNDLINKAYQAALSAGHDSSRYMFSNKQELWANGTQAWFHGISRTDVNEGINTREKLRLMLPDLAALMEEVYGDGDWHYISDCANPSKWAPYGQTSG